MRIDCKAAVDTLLAGRERAVAATRLTARAWVAIFEFTGGTPPVDCAWMPAHTAAAAVGRRVMSNGVPLTARDRLGNELADKLAKEAVEQHRVPAVVCEAIRDQERAVEDMARWVARVTVAATGHGPAALRDSDSAPAGRRRGAAPARRRRRPPAHIPAALGGHDVAWQGCHLARPWQCRLCRRSAAKRLTLDRARCPGSAVARWAQAAEAAADLGAGSGGGHVLLLTGPVVWCWRCGANACVRAQGLAKACPGVLRGFLAQAHQRLLLGLHPGSRRPLEAETVPEPGAALPRGFAAAVRRAEASRTTAAHAVHTQPKLSARSKLGHGRLVG